ncbi:hypothetical protein ASC91_24655 [Pelomonas sp. Root1237]|nr:hypothetical protein ASC91_24655 [Pelomonas sp. Root1237]
MTKLWAGGRVPIRAVFGRMQIDAIKPHHVRGYMDKRGQQAKARANREKALLSHLFNKARGGTTPTPRTPARA